MRRFDTVICWESQNLRESVIDLTRLIELTGGNSGAYLFVCTKCQERLEKAKKNVEGIKGRSAAFISPLNTILKTES